MTFFSRVETWRIPGAAFTASLREMARDGVAGNEGVALWLGHRANQVAEVTRVVVLRSPSVRKRPDQLVIPPEVINDVTDLAIDLQLVLVGQIHSHGRLYGTDLSLADRRYGIAVPSYLSIVAPDFALRPETRITDCGVHEFDPTVGFRRLSESEVSARVQIDSGASAPVLEVGGSL